MRLTTSGIVFTIAGAALIIAAYRFGIPGFLPAGILLIAMVLCGTFMGLAMGSRTRESIDVSAPQVHGTPVVRAGQPVRVRVHLRNPLPVGTGALTVVLHTVDGFGPDQRAHVPQVPGRSSAAVDAWFHPKRRGMFGIAGVTTTVAAPFGLALRRATHSTRAEVAVAPAELRFAAGTDFGGDTDDTAVRLTRGGGTRDFDTRPYVPGDDLRHVHWASTARLGELMVRTEAREESPRLTVLLDLAEPSDAAEALLTAVAACARTASQAQATVAMHAPDDAIECLPGDTSLVDVFLARAQFGRLEPLGTPTRGFTLVVTDADRPVERMAQLLPPGVRRQVWDTSALRSASVTPEQLADGLIRELPWRLETRWGR